MNVPDSLTASLSDRYWIERELGAGGMATVYLAEDLKHHRRVAIKVLKPELGAALGAERFLREIKVVAGLRHPHILPLYDSGEAVTPSTFNQRPSTHLYYVMPYVEGETLRARMDRERQLPVEEALRIAREVADALSYAHVHGVIHRDIKPENILLEAGHAVVADFGIARAVASAGEATALTETGMSVGTPSYMSPEQSAGDPNVDGRSDLYSLGCVLYEMLAGQPPFTGPTVESLVRQHITAPAPPVTQFRPAVPPAVADALARALAKNPADRFNPVDQFGAALERTGERKEGRAERASARRPLWIAAAAVASLVLAGAAWVGLQGSDAREASIAVLPFRLAEADTSSSALALGIQGELITQLTRVPGLRVISRGSARAYQGSGKPERQIAEELGVATLLVGEIQRVGDQIRLTVSLNDPERNTELWAEHYDRRLTTDNLFAVQGEVARAVAGALSVEFAPGSGRDSTPPTDNLAALEMYYRAEELQEQGSSSEADSMSLDLAERAVALDPSFARGWEMVTRIRSWMVRLGSVAHAAPARQAMERTQAVAPGSVEAGLAEGYFLYYTEADFTGALEAMDAAARLEPGSTDLLRIRALLNRRLGQWDSAVALLRRAAETEPRNSFLLGTLGETLGMMRRYNDAEPICERAAAFDPTSTFVQGPRVWSLLNWRGDTRAAEDLALQVMPILDPWTRANIMLSIAVYTRDLDAALKVSAADLDRDRRLIPNYTHRHLLVGVLERSLGHAGAARAHADSLRRAALDFAQGLRAEADPFGKLVLVELNLALADALAGNGADAVKRAETAVVAFPLERDAVEAPDMHRLLAMTYALVGEKQKAIQVLRKLLARPGNLHRGELRLSPAWDNLRETPEFEALLVRGEK